MSDDDAVPAGVVTEITPVAPLPITALILLAGDNKFPSSNKTVNEFASVSPNLTEDASVSSVPIIVTVVPVIPLDGVKDVIVVGDKIVILKV